MLLGLVAAAAFGFAGSAQAAGIETMPALEMRITSDQGIDRLLTAAAMGCEGGPGYTGFAGSCYGYDYDLGGGATLTSLSLNFVVDPEVHLNLSLRNGSSVIQTFTLETTLPTDPFAGPNRMGGSVGGSLTESNGGGSGASLSAVAGSAIYTALIDGVGVQQLLASPFVLSVGNNFETANVPATAFGQPIPNAAAPSVLGSIGIRLQFRLSPGDQVALSSVFVVQTPEPAIGALLAAAGLALVALRRRLVGA
jgi:outer membrane lipoprotein SlyB